MISIDCDGGDGDGIFEICVAEQPYSQHKMISYDFCKRN